MSTRRAFSLVEILVVLVILLILFAVLAPHYPKGGKSKDGKTSKATMGYYRVTPANRFVLLGSAQQDRDFSSDDGGTRWRDRFHRCGEILDAVAAQTA